MSFLVLGKLLSGAIEKNFGKLGQELGGGSRKGMAEDELDRNEIIRGLVVSSLHFILSVLGNPWKLSKGQ